MATTESNVDGAGPGTPFWERLYGIFVRERDKTQRQEEQPRRRSFVIAIATLVSALLWFTFSMQERYTALLQLPTQVVNLPENQALSQLPPSTIRVQIEGEGLSLIRLSLNTPTVPINAQREEVQLREVVSEVLQNVDLLGVTPGTLNLQKERRITRTVPIRLHADIRTPPTHDLIAPPQMEPDSVQITGAASVIWGIESWPTESVVYRDLRDSLRVRVGLSDTLNGLVARNVDATILTATSKQFTEGTREIDVTVTEQPSNQELVTLDPSTIRVKYRVLFDQYREAQQAMDFFATVSYDEIRRDTTGRVRPRVTLPRGVVLKDVEIFPQTLRYYQRIE